MSRAIMTCALTTMLTLSFACSAQAPNVVAQQLYDQLDQSFANHDQNQMLRFVDSSYVSIDERGRRIAFAQYRKLVEEWFARTRHVNPSTIVLDVQAQPGRMVVYAKTEMHYELHDHREGWLPRIQTVSATETWERKGGEWKIVLSKTLRVDTRVDPEWVEQTRQDWEMAERVIRCCRDH